MYCVTNTPCNANKKEPLLPHPVLTHPWEKVEVDYFTLDRMYPELSQVTSKTAQATIAKLKMIFA